MHVFIINHPSLWTCHISNNLQNYLAGVYHKCQANRYSNYGNTLTNMKLWTERVGHIVKKNVEFLVNLLFTIEPWGACWKQPQFSCFPSGVSKLKLLSKSLKLIPKGLILPIGITITELMKLELWSHYPRLMTFEVNWAHVLCSKMVCVHFKQGYMKKASSNL